LCPEKANDHFVIMSGTTTFNRKLNQTGPSKARTQP